MLLQLLLFCAPALACPPQESRSEEFDKRFAAAVELEDIQEMERLLRRYTDEAVFLFMAKAEERAMAGGSRELNRWVDELIETWSRAFRSDFGRNYDRFLQLMDSRRRAARDEMMRLSVPLVNDAFLKAFETKDYQDWLGVRSNVGPMIASFEDVGDLYYAAYGYKILGFAWQTDNMDSGGDNVKALEAFEKFLEVRERLELTQDKDYGMIKTHVRNLRGLLGVADPETGEVPDRDISEFEILPVEGAEWLSVDLEAGEEEKPGSVEHGNDLADGDRVSWRPGSVGAVGSEAEVPYVEPRVVIKRVGFSNFQLHAGGEPSEEFSLRTKPVHVRYQRKHEDGRISEHSLALAGGLDKDDYNGTQMNFAANDQTVFFFYRSPATRTAKTPFGPITIYDLDGDGKFGAESAQLTGALGMPPETFLYRLDGILLGKSKHSLPFSRWINDRDGSWYEVELKDHAAAESVKLRPVAPNLGTVSVTAKGYKGGMKLVSLVFESQTRQTKGLLVDLMAGKRGTSDIPAGDYVFRQGLLRGEKGAEAVIVPPRLAPLRIEVIAGEKVELAVGAPFTLAADYHMEGETLVVPGSSLHVVGKAGERYVRMVGAPLFRTDVAAKGSRPDSLSPPETADVGRDWNAAYWPRDGFLKIGKEARPPLRLTLKKHPWFGNLDSGWIE